MATVQAYVGSRPWRATATSWSILASHDTARIRTIVRTRQLHEVAAGRLFTMPGAPMVFAGDEIGLRGTFGEDARTPFPWNHENTWDRHTLDTYRDLAALRRDCRALRHGGLRWVAAAGDALAYLRECPDERLMVLALRAACPALQVPAWLLGLTGEAPNVFGGAAALRAAAGGDVALPGDGLTYQVWRLG